MSVTCFSCGTSFQDNKELALHISSSKKRMHTLSSRTWAANFLSQTRRLNSKKDLPGRTPLTEEQKEAKHSTKREIDETAFIRVVTRCPQCKMLSEESLLEAYVVEDGVHAWRKGHVFFRLCVNHRDKEPRQYRTKSENFGQV
jgi:hypothetical protein